MKKSSIFVKHAQSGDEANLHSCYCSKHGYCKSKCHNLHNVQLFWHICRTNCTNKLQNFPPDLNNGGWVPNSTVMTVLVAIFESRLIKMAAAGKVQISL